METRSFTVPQRHRTRPFVKISQFEAYRTTLVENAEQRVAKQIMSGRGEKFPFKNLKFAFVLPFSASLKWKLWEFLFFEAFHVCQPAETIKYFIPEGDSTKQRFSLRTLTCTDENNIVRFTTWRFYLWIDSNLCESVPGLRKAGRKVFDYSDCALGELPLWKQFSTYCVLTRVNIGSPKYGGTFSSINECVLMKFKVASGSARESLWQEPGLGSGICKDGKRTRVE